VRSSKYHLLSWSKVSFSISKGGLGARNLLMFSCALLGKWLCHYVYEGEARWKVVVDSKFGSSWVGDVLMSLLKLMVWVYEKILGGVGGRSLTIPDLKWEMASKLVSGMIFVAGIWPLRALTKPFQII
jgi:hypothetical protein